MNTEEVSPEEIENTRTLCAHNQAELLRAVARVTQVRAAACMGVSPSTINRRIDDLKDCCGTLAAFGLQFAPLGAMVAPHGSMVVDPDDLTALKRLALRYLQADLMERDQRGDA